MSPFGPEQISAGQFDTTTASSSLDGLSDPILLNDGLIVSDELVALKGAYFAGEVNAKDVREFFERNVTVGKRGEIVSTKGGGAATFKPPTFSNFGTRPLFSIDPTRIGGTSQPFSFYFQNWEDVYAPVKLFFIPKNEELPLQAASRRGRVMLPVPPESFELSGSNALEEVVTASGNTFLHSGPEVRETMTIEGFFPHVIVQTNKFDNWINRKSTTIPEYIPLEVLKYGLYSATTLKNMFIGLRDSAQPVRFTVCIPGVAGSSGIILNKVVVVTDFTSSYRHGHGLDIFYSMNLKTWKPQKLVTFDKKKPGRPGDGPPPLKKYQIKSNKETLWGIADRLLGNPKRWKEIYKLNKKVLDAAVRAHHRKAPNPKLLYAGTIIQIPRRK